MSATAFGELFNELVDPPPRAGHGGDRGGLVATFVANASVVPDEPRVAVGIARHHFTWGLIDRSRSFALHMVDHDRPEWVRRFGLGPAARRTSSPGLFRR